MCFKWIKRKLSSYITDRIIPKAEKMIQDKVDEEIKKLKMEADEQLNKMMEKAKNLENEVIDAVRKAYPEATALAETVIEGAGVAVKKFGNLMDSTF